MMWYFTGKGDTGKTTLFDGTRVRKDNQILDLMGTIDELNSFIGLTRTEIKEEELNNDLLFVQSSLSKLMGMIAGAPEQSLFDFDTGKFINWLESKIKLYSKKLMNPQAFTFPGVSKTGALFDICRTVCRRAERKAVEVSQSDIKDNNDIITVLNRLSSYFYILRLFFEE